MKKILSVLLPITSLVFIALFMIGSYDILVQIMDLQLQAIKDNWHYIVGFFITLVINLSFFLKR